MLSDSKDPRDTMIDEEQDVAYVASDGYYGDDPDDLVGEHDEIQISYSDGMTFEFSVTATDEGTVTVERRDWKADNE